MVMVWYGTRGGEVTWVSDSMVWCGILWYMVWCMSVCSDDTVLYNMVWRGVGAGGGVFARSQSVARRGRPAGMI